MRTLHKGCLDMPFDEYIEWVMLGFNPPSIVGVSPKWALKEYHIPHYLLARSPPRGATHPRSIHENTAEVITAVWNKLPAYDKSLKPKKEMPNESLQKDIVFLDLVV